MEKIIEKIILYQFVNSFANKFFNGRIDYKIALLKSLKEQENGKRNKV